MIIADADDRQPLASGELTLQTVAMPADTNPRGDIFAGWLVSQMDLAAGVRARKVCHGGRVVTVAINSMQFMTPVHVGAVVSCYTDITRIGRSSVHMNVEVWIDHKTTFDPVKVTEGEFVFVAIDDNGRTRAIPPQD